MKFTSKNLLLCKNSKIPIKIIYQVTARQFSISVDALDSE